MASGGAVVASCDEAGPSEKTRSDPQEGKAPEAGAFLIAGAPETGFPALPNTGWGRSIWSRIPPAERRAWIKAKWSRLPEGRKDQFRERVSEAARLRFQAMSVEQRRQQSAAGREKRWLGHTPLRMLSTEARRARKTEYMRWYRGVGPKPAWLNRGTSRAQAAESQ